MFRTILVSVLLLAAQSAHSAEAINKAQSVESTSGGDSRQLVSMPVEARELMRKDMLDHLSALTEIIGYLAGNDLETAAKVSEARMGLSSTGKHRSTGMGPGSFMPLEMRNLGMGMHEAASEFSAIAKKGDVSNAFRALQKVTASCVGCHYTYRTR